MTTSYSELQNLPEDIVRLLEEAGDGPADEARRFELLQRLLGPAMCHKLGIYPLPADFLLSVVVPVYNEVDTLPTVLRRIRTCGVRCEIIVVDDGSTDGTRALLEGLDEEPDLKVLCHDRNRGKGAALKTGFLQATTSACSTTGTTWATGC